MNNKSFKIGIALGMFVILSAFVFLAGATNFDRLVLGSGNYETDPNSTADITFQNDEYITNATDGTLDFGSAIMKIANVNADSGAVVGLDAFTTTATTDTVTISGALTTDVYIVSGSGGSVDQQDVLQWEALEGKLVVHRLASGASALAYSWIRITYY